MKTRQKLAEIFQVEFAERLTREVKKKSHVAGKICVIHKICVFELDLGILNYLGEDYFDMKPAVKEAFKASKGVSKKSGNDDFVERSEFRLLMVNLR